MTTKVTVNGVITFADGAFPSSAVVNFTLSTWDGEGNEVIVPGADGVSVNVNPTTGAFSASLWTNDVGDYNTFYHVAVTEFFSGDEYTGTRTVTRDLGGIVVPGAGPVELKSLLFNTKLIGATFEHSASRGDSINLAAVILRSPNVRMSLVGVTVTATITHTDGTSFPFAVTYPDRIRGRIDLDIVAGVTDDAPAGAYTLEIKASSGVRRTTIYGRITLI